MKKFLVRPHAPIKLGKFTISHTKKLLTTDRFISLSDKNHVLHIRRIIDGTSKKAVRLKFITKGTIVTVKENEHKYIIITKPSKIAYGMKVTNEVQ